MIKPRPAFFRFAVAVGVLALNVPLNAWFNAGHMTVAYIAYQKLTPKTRARVDALIRLNPLYSTWAKGVPAKSVGAMTAFVMAATWPDCIKEKTCSPGFTNDTNTPPGTPADGRNIGYSDKLMHKYWHFADVPLSAGAPGHPPAVPNAETQIKLLANAIGTKEVDAIKSYDVVWLEHMIGDVHQPLHAISRFTKNHPQGDAGGNLLLFCTKPCRDELHAFWDGLPGDSLTLHQVAVNGDTLLKRPKPDAADQLDASVWIAESFALAKSDVYIAPISEDNDPKVTISPRPDAKYQANAMAKAQDRVLLAGYRLAAVLNQNLK